MSRTLQITVNKFSRQKRIIYSVVSLSFCLVLIFSSLERAGAAGGGLDPFFNLGNVGASDDVLAVAVQPDGKILIGGTFTTYNNNNVSDFIFRLNANGTRDTTFNSGGTGANGTVRAIVVEPNGDILIGGDFTSYNGNAAVNDGILRLNTNGTPDTSFNEGGSGVVDGTVNAIALDGNGGILIGGTFTDYVDFDSFGIANDNIVRLFSNNGRSDPAFNSSGNLVGANNSVLAVVVQPNGGTDLTWL